MKTVPIYARETLANHSLAMRVELVQAMSCTIRKTNGQL